MRCRPYGPSAWLVEGLADPVGWSAGLLTMAVPGVTEVVPAEDTVLVTCEPSRRDAVAQAFERVVPLGGGAGHETLDIDVRYDGPDVAAVAERTGLTVAEVVAAHQTAEYTVAFCGFSPGFAYLRGLPDQLRLPRRDQPRTVVPAGSVAIAAHYSAIYPSASPGGWHLLGHTEATVWDVARREPARLVPGTVVRFRAV